MIALFSRKIIGFSLWLPATTRPQTPDRTFSNDVQVLKSWKGRSFTVYQSKGVTENLNLERYKEVDVNGQKGYVNSNKFDGQEGAIYDTDLKWYKDDRY